MEDRPRIFAILLDKFAVDQEEPPLPPIDPTKESSVNIGSWNSTEEDSLWGLLLLLNGSSSLSNLSIVELTSYSIFFIIEIKWTNTFLVWSLTSSNPWEIISLEILKSWNPLSLIIRYLLPSSVNSSWNLWSCKEFPFFFLRVSLRLQISFPVDSIFLTAALLGMRVDYQAVSVSICILCLATVDNNLDWRSPTTSDCRLFRNSVWWLDNTV